MGTVYKVLGEKTISDSPKYFRSRLVVENCENIHLHYRNLRLEFSKGEFIEFADLMAEARANLNPCELKEIALDLIDPWDESHSQVEDENNLFAFKADPQDLHDNRINEVKQAIEEGKRIRPILVSPIGDGRYKRKDGFCRYMAHKILSKEKIECIVLDNAPAGGQDNKAYIIDDEEYQQIKDGKTL